MNLRPLLPFAAAALSVFASACADEQGTLASDVAARDVDVETSPESSQPEPQLVFSGISDGHLNGTIGPAAGIDQPAETMNLFDDGTYLSVNTVVRMPDRFAMVVFDVSYAGDILVPGAHIEQGPDGLSGLYAIGCTGIDGVNFNEFDALADTIEVDVEAGEAPGEVVVDILSTFPDVDGNPGPQASTHFVLRH